MALKVDIEALSVSCSVSEVLGGLSRWYLAEVLIEALHPVWPLAGGSLANSVVTFVLVSCITGLVVLLLSWTCRIPSV